MKTDTTRRSFLAGVAALLGAPVIAAIPLRYAVAPSVLNQPRRWLWVHGSGWRLAQDSLDRVMNITAERSDGQFFCVIARLRPKDQEGPSALVRHIAEVDIANAYATLNDFLNCDCTVSKACARHYIEPPTEEELAALDLY